MKHFLWDEDGFRSHLLNNEVIFIFIFIGILFSFQLFIFIDKLSNLFQTLSLESKILPFRTYHQVCAKLQVGCMCIALFFKNGINCFEMEISRGLVFCEFYSNTMYKVHKMGASCALNIQCETSCASTYVHLQSNCMFCNQTTILCCRFWYLGVVTHVFCLPQERFFSKTHLITSLPTNTRLRRLYIAAFLSLSTCYCNCAHTFLISCM